MISLKAMTGAANKRRKTIDDNMIPLINIVFLLLIFFMVSSQISAMSGANIQPPLTSHEQQDRIKTAEARIEIKSREDIYFENSKTSLPQLALALKDRKLDSVNVSGDKSLQAADLDALLNVLRESGVKKIALLAKKGEAIQ